MPSVGAFEAKTHLGELLERVAQGERITITKRGTPIATLVPPESAPRYDRGEVIAALKQFGVGRKLSEGVTVRDLIEEGRRF